MLKGKKISLAVSAALGSGLIGLAPNALAQASGELRRTVTSTASPAMTGPFCRRARTVIKTRSPAMLFYCRGLRFTDCSETP